MKTITSYKSDYKKRVTQKGKQSVMNRAILNLSYDDKQKFIKWQINRMTVENLQLTNSR